MGSDVLVDEWTDEQGKGEEEVAYCRGLLYAGERLLAILASRGAAEHNRLAMTDGRIILYSKDNHQDVLWFSYLQVLDFRGRRHNIFHHLGDITIVVEGQTLKFADVGIEYVDQAVNIFEASKKAAPATTAYPTPRGFQGQPETGTVCPGCGHLNQAQDRFCRNCGAQLK